MEYKINEDGTFTNESELEYEVLKENARDAIGLRRLNFESAGTKLEVKDAYTIFDGKKVPVRPEHIEVKPLASQGQGFDETSQISVAFPQVGVGSRVHYRTSLKARRPKIPGLFSVHYPLGQDEFEKRLELIYDSAVPLYYEVHDPEDYLDVKYEQGKRYVLKFTLKRPLFRQLVQEEHALLNARALPWVAVSTRKSWADFPKYTPQKYEDALSAELPGRFRPVLERAKQEKEPLAQINAVTSRLVERMRYVGDWAPVEGGHHPRPLALVAETGFGDCKDFSSVTANMLRRLGFEAHVAWVFRGKDPVLSPLTTVAAPTFNHAIVYAKKEGREYWIDPTNFASFSAGVFDDIADRPAVLMNPAHVELKRVPPMQKQDGSTELVYHLHLRGKETAEAKGYLHVRGRGALRIAGWSLAFSKSQTDYYFADWIYGASRLDSWNLPPYELSSRVVKDFRTEFTLEPRLRPTPTSAGRGLPMPANPFLSPFEQRREGRVGALLLGEPTTWSREITVSGAAFQHARDIRCRGRSPWIDYSFALEKKGKGLRQTDRVELKKASITAEELQSPAYAKLQRELTLCLQPATVVLR